MLTLSSIRPFAGSKKTSKRLGRGKGSGKGAFSGRGCKGQNARSGSKFNPLFEGGQTPLHMRMPKKKGFTNFTQKSFEVVNIRDIQEMANRGFSTVTIQDLCINGFVRKEDSRVKLLAVGELSAAITITVHAISAEAKAKIEKSGGKVEVIA